MFIELTLLAWHDADTKELPILVNLELVTPKSRMQSSPIE